MNEVEWWVDVKGYEGYYQVSNLGRVRSLDRGMYVSDVRYPKPRWIRRKGRVLKNYTDGTDRRIVVLQMFGVGKTITVHRLVALHFLPNPDNFPVVNHINHDHHDNRASNLEWCTQKHNIGQAIAAGRMNHIFKQHEKLTKITKSQAIKIKKLLALGLGRSRVAKDVGVGYDTVYHISVGDTWKHI